MYTIVTMDTPKIKVPPGHVVEDLGDGNYQVRPLGQARTKTVSFRLTASEYEPLLAFIETHPTGVSDAMRSLVTDERVLAVMRERVAAQTRPRKRAQ